MDCTSELCTILTSLKTEATPAQHASHMIPQWLNDSIEFKLNFDFNQGKSRLVVKFYIVIPLPESYETSKRTILKSKLDTTIHKQKIHSIKREL